MTGSDMIRLIMKEAGFTQTMLARSVGLKNQSNVSEMLKADLKISVFTRFLNTMGYEVIVRKKRPGKQGDGYKMEID